MAASLTERLTDLAHDGLERLDARQVASMLPGSKRPKRARRRATPVSTAMRWTVVGGCVLWAIAAHRDAEKWAERIGTTPKEVKALARRDARSALALARAKDPLPQFAKRVMYDGSDALRHGKDRPSVMLVGLGFGALSAIGAAAELFNRRGSAHR